MKKIRVLAIISLITFSTMGIKAQVKISVGADFVSAYIWRGQDCGPAAFQPEISISYAGFSLSAWGSTSLQGTNKEFDLLLNYEIAGFSIGITDYFFPVGNYFDYKTHQFEANLSYTVSEKLPLSFAWNTMFAGNDKDTDNKARFSSYAEIAYSLSLKYLTLDFAVGVTPWGGIYADDTSITQIAITGSKAIEITEKYAIPIFAQVTLNPDKKDVNLIFGISF